MLGKKPNGWFDDDFDYDDGYDTVNSLYTVFKIAIDDMNYKRQELNNNERYFCSFVLSVVSRYRLDAEWLGEFLPKNIDDVDGVYFTQAELASLIGVTKKQFEGILAHVESWLSDPAVLDELQDDLGDKYSDIERRIQSHTIGRDNLQQAAEQWKNKFKYSVNPEDFDFPDDVPCTNSILSNYKELEGYLVNRSYNKEIDKLYPHKNAKCLLNLLAVKGYYKPTH